MTDRVEQLFEDFRRTGSPDALAEVYDHTAPQLLRVAMHLVPDAAAAEDLVQSTFLTAIEKAAEVDPGRPLRPWLIGVLHNHARNRRRLRDAGHRTGSSVPELEAPPPEGPPNLAHLHEFESSVDAAIDELPEAYRPVLVLRLKHGLGPADIAHALRRPPGTVRTQLVRGLERLRGILPAALATSLALWATPTRGLAAVREAVLAHATAIAPAAAAGATAVTGATTLFASLFAMKKLLLVASALLALAVGYALWPETPRDAAGGTPNEAAGVERRADAARDGDTRRADAGDRGAPERRAASLPDTHPAGDATARWTLVAHLETVPGVPATGATLHVHAGRPGDEPTSFARLMEYSSSPSPDSESLLLATDGPPLASVAVATDGRFVVPDLVARHVRVRLEHRFYGLVETLPVHARPGATNVDVGELDVYCGGHVVGRVLGREAPAGARVLLTVDPDPMGVLRDPGAFLAHSMRGGGAETTLDAGGRFEFRAVTPAPNVSVELRAGAVFGRVPALPLRAGETREILLVPEPTGALSLQVHDAEGAAVAGARARLVPQDVEGQFRIIRAARDARTGDAGSARVDDLPPGAWTLRIERDGFLGEVRELRIAAEDEVDLDVRLQRGPQVVGRVLDTGGAPVADARLALWPKVDVPLVGDVSRFAGVHMLARRAERSPIRSDAEGRFVIGGADDAQPWSLIVTHPDFAPAFTDAGPADGVPVEVVLQRPATVRGRVVTDAGEPVPAFTVRLLQDAMLFFTRPVVVERIEGSTDGAFALPAVPPGDYRLELESVQGGAAEQNVALAAGAEHDIGDVALEAPATVRGRVVDGRGAPIAGATVRRSRGGLGDNPVMAMFFRRATTHSAADGRFELPGLRPGLVVLLAESEHAAPARSRPVRVAGGETVDDLRIEMPDGGAIEGRVVTAPGVDPRGWEVLVTLEPQTDTRTAAVSPDGHFRVEHLAPGRYQVQAMQASGLARMNTAMARQPNLGGIPDIGQLMRDMQEMLVIERVRLRGDETATVELDTTDLGVGGLRLVVELDDAGEAIGRAMAEVTNVGTDGSEELRMLFLDGTRLEVGNLQPGLARVQLRSGVTMAPLGEPLEVALPADAQLVERRWSLPSGRIAGTVVEADSGEPLSGAAVRLVAAELARSGRSGDPGFALTDARGRFDFPALEPGTYAVVADESLLGGGDTSGRVDGLRLSTGEVRDDVVLRVAPGAGAEVVVTGPGAAPLPRARVLVVDVDGNPASALPRAAVADSEGRATLTGLAASRVRAVAWAEGLAPAVSELQTVDAGGRTRFDLGLGAGTPVELRLVDAAGRPLAGASVAVRFGDGPWLPTVLLGRRLPDAQGRIDLGPLPPGRVRFAVRHPAARFETARDVPRSRRAAFVLHP